MNVSIDSGSSSEVNVDFLRRSVPTDDFEEVYVDRWAVHNPIFRSDLEFGIYVSMLCDTHPITNRLIFLQKKVSARWNLPIRTIKQIARDLVEERIFLHIEDCYPHFGGVELEINRSYRHPPPGMPRLPPREMRRERISVHLREEIFKASGGICSYCHFPMTRSEGPRQFHIDHRVALTKGGSERRRNLVAACKTCNLRKGTKRPGEFLPAEDMP